MPPECFYVALNASITCRAKFVALTFYRCGAESQTDTEFENQAECLLRLQVGSSESLLVSFLLSNYAAISSKYIGLMAIKASFAGHNTLVYIILVHRFAMRPVCWQRNRAGDCSG